MSPTLSAIICTKDRPESLRRTLETLFAQTRLPDEIVIVDDGRLDRQDWEAWIGHRNIPFQYLRKDAPGLTASRNLAAANARGDILLFLDDDVLLEPSYLAAIEAIYAGDPRGQIGGVTGALRFEYRRGVRAYLRFFGLDGCRPGALLPGGYGVLVRQGEISDPVEVQWLAGCNMSYRREVFRDFQFDPSLGAYGWGEDRDFSVRVGCKYRLVATPDARLVHLKEPAGRIRPRQFGFMETNYLYRFFARNMPHRWVNYLALAWAWTGIVLRNLLMFVSGPGRRQKLALLRGNLEGLCAIPSGKDFSP